MVDISHSSITVGKDNKQYLITMTSQGVVLVSDFFTTCIRNEHQFSFMPNKTIIEGEIGQTKIVQTKKDYNISEEDIANLIMEWHVWIK